MRICGLRHAHEVGLGRRAEVGVVHVMRWLQGESRGQAIVGVLVYGTSLYEGLIGRDVESQDVEIYHLREGEDGERAVCVLTRWPPSSGLISHRLAGVGEAQTFTVHRSPPAASPILETDVHC
jgi:hypothetical protein